MNLSRNKPTSRSYHLSISPFSLFSVSDLSKVLDLTLSLFLLSFLSLLFLSSPPSIVEHPNSLLHLFLPTPSFCLLNYYLTFLLCSFPYLRVVSMSSQETLICKIIISKGSHDTINEGVIISSEDPNDTVAISYRIPRSNIGS